MAKKTQQKPLKNEDKRLLAFITTFFSILGFVIALLAWRNNKYVMHYAEQSLVVFAYIVVASLVSGIIGWIPIIGWLIALALYISSLIFWIMSWVYALSGKEQELPFIGAFGRAFNLR